MSDEKNVSKKRIIRLLAVAIAALILAGTIYKAAKMFETEKPDSVPPRWVKAEFLDSSIGMYSFYLDAFGKNCIPVFSALDVEMMKRRIAEKTNSNLCYVLINDIDFSKFPDWNGFAEFSGKFYGNGHIISNIKGSSGLFTKLSKKALVRDLGIHNAAIIKDKDDQGILADTIQDETEVINVYIKDSSVVKSEKSNRGGLIGSINGGTVSHCYTKLNVTGKNNVGGLVGSIKYGTIKNSHTAGKISGKEATGGLVGYVFKSIINNSYTTGEITGDKYSGGLAGNVIKSIIDNSYTTGGINGRNYSGGLVGNLGGTVKNSYATGNIKGKNVSGGLVGGILLGSANRTDKAGVKTANTKDEIYVIEATVDELRGGLISNSYSTGKVTSEAYTGGLVGSMIIGSIENSYATGNIKGDRGSQGLIGNRQAPILGNIVSNSYYTGKNDGK